MGRGRAKAKQTKVARELKYRPIGTDLNALRAELTGNGRSGDSHAAEPATADDKDVDDDDPYAAYVTDDDDDEDEDDQDPAVDRWVAPR